MINKLNDFLATQFAESRIIPAQTNIHGSMAVRYAHDAAMDMALFKDIELKEREKELFNAFIDCASHLYDNTEDEFFKEEVNNFKKHLKVYDPDK